MVICNHGKKVADKVSEYKINFNLYFYAEKWNDYLIKKIISQQVRESERERNWWTNVFNVETNKQIGKKKLDTRKKL